MSEIVRADPRLAGDVKRYHTWPVHHQQSVAHHSWNVARILLEIWPSAPREAIIYAITHDMGEVATGDVPFPVKRENPDLKAIMDRLEDGALRTMGVRVPELDEHWSRVLKICDLLEMMEFGIAEQVAGNHLGRVIHERTRDLILNELIWSLPAAEQRRVEDWAIGRENWGKRCGL